MENETNSREPANTASYANVVHERDFKHENNPMDSSNDRIVLSDHDFALFKKLMQTPIEPPALAVDEMRQYMIDVANGDLVIVEPQDTDAFGMPRSSIN